MEYLSEILSFIVGALAGGLTVKVQMSRSTQSGQSGNKVGGDLAGRDVNKNGR